MEISDLDTDPNLMDYSIFDNGLLQKPYSRSEAKVNQNFNLSLNFTFKWKINWNNCLFVLLDEKTSEHWYDFRRRHLKRRFA